MEDFAKGALCKETFASERASSSFSPLSTTSYMSPEFSPCSYSPTSSPDSDWSPGEVERSSHDIHPTYHMVFSTPYSPIKCNPGSVPISPGCSPSASPPQNPRFMMQKMEEDVFSESDEDDREMSQEDTSGNIETKNKSVQLDIEVTYTDIDDQILEGIEKDVALDKKVTTTLNFQEEMSSKTEALCNEEAMSVVEMKSNIKQVGKEESHLQKIYDEGSENVKKSVSKGNQEENNSVKFLDETTEKLSLSNKCMENHRDTDEDENPRKRRKLDMSNHFIQHSGTKDVDTESKTKYVDLQSSTSVESKHYPQKIVIHTRQSANSTENHILIILSRISQMDNPSKYLVTIETMCCLLDYIRSVYQAEKRAARILSRLLQNPLCFEQFHCFEYATVGLCEAP